MLRLNKYAALLLGIILLGCLSCDRNSTNDDVDINDVDTTTPEPDPEPSPITWEDCGGQLGDHACDFTFTDQNGNDWNLYEQYGDIVVLDFSTMWCYYCQVAAGHAQDMQDTYGPDGVLWVTVLIDDVSGGEVDQADLTTWVETYGILTAPVLAGDRSIIDLSAEDGYPLSSWPTFIIVNREMEIEWGLHGWSDSMIVEQLEVMLDNEAQ